MEKHKILGVAGEDFAAKYLTRQGLKVVAQNVHAQGGELDIIAYNKKTATYILVEVKTRTHEGFALGLEAVGSQKQRKMQRAAAYYFLKKRGFKDMPVFEIHAMILTPKPNLTFWEKRQNKLIFKVDYYDDLS